MNEGVTDVNIRQKVDVVTLLSVLIVKYHTIELLVLNEVFQLFFHN